MAPRHSGDRATPGSALLWSHAYMGLNPPYPCREFPVDKRGKLLHHLMTIHDISKAKDMRTIIDLPERDVKNLTELGRERGMSRAEVIRQAIKVFLIFHQASRDGAFGLWRKRSEDGLRYQRAVRAEWGE
jgi:Ribbon-helix-helix protein, copG family